MRKDAGKRRVAAPASPRTRRPGDIFVGRDRELGQLQQALADAGRGRGSVAVLVGEAGIGKTRTAHELAELAASAGAPGVTVLKGRCYEGEETPPYGPWRSALRPLPAARLAPEAAAVIAAVGDSPPSLPAAEARLRLFDAVIDLLRAAAGERTVLLLLDNLQWADPGSLKLLEHLSGEIPGIPLFVVGTYRDTDLDPRHPLGSTLAELAKESGFLRIPLRGFSPSEVGRYLEAAMDVEPSAALIQSIHERTDGNPLFLLELVRDMREAEQSTLGRLRIPAGVKEAIGARLSRMPEECARVLGAASVIGRTFATALLAVLVDDLSDGVVLAALERAQRSGFVHEIAEEPGHYRFAHALVQEVLYEGLPAQRRSALHGRVAEALERLAGSRIGRHAASIVHHLAEAGDPQSRARLVPIALAAAEHAVANLAPDRALEILERALEAKEAAGDEETAGLLYRRGCVLEDLGRTKEAAESLTGAFDLYAGLGVTDRLVEIALTPVQHAIPIGLSSTWSYADSGLSELRERALERVRPGSIEEARLLAQQPSPADIERALAIARREGDENLETKALWHLAYVHLCAGEIERSRAEETAARSIASRLEDPWGARFLLYLGCRSSALVGDLAAVGASARQMLADAERAHSRLSLAAARQANAIIACQQGDWEGCREHARECLRLQSGRGETHSHAVALATRALAECETGNREAAEECLRSLGTLTGDPRAPFPFYLPKMAWITGDTGRIEAAAEALASVAASGPPFDWLTLSRNVASALVAIMRSDREEAARFLATYARFQGLCIPYNASGMPCDALAALCLQALGRHEEACARFEKALAFCRRARFLPELARTCRDYGEALVRHGGAEDATRADAVLREGLAMARDLAMAPTVARIEAARREAEHRRPAGRPPEAAGLTSREIEILRLVARGLTNAEIGERLFISANTVARHVQNVLDKTGMANRTEATAFAFRHGIIEE